MDAVSFSLMSFFSFFDPLLVIILLLVYNPLCCTGIYEWLYLFFSCYIFIFIDFSLTLTPLLETCGFVVSGKETPET